MHSIPEGWSVKTLEQIAVSKGLVRGPFGGALKKDTFVRSGYRVYEQRDAIYGTATESRYFINQSKYQELSRFAVKPGDFIVSCSGTIGRIFRLPENASDGVINQALLKITLNEQLVNSDYFYNYFKWDRFQAKIIDSTQGGAMQNLVGMDIFKKTELLLPPIEEQNKVAEILGSWDKYLDILDQKIAVKTSVREGLIQQLLTGNTRIAGFTQDWKQYRIKDIFDFIGTYSHSKDQMAYKDVQEDSILNIHYGDIHTKYSNYIDVTKQQIPYLVDAGQYIDEKKLLQEGDIVVADASEDYAGVGECVEIINLGGLKCIAGLHTFALRDKGNNIAKGYGSLILSNSEVHNWMKRVATYSKVYGITKSSDHRASSP